MLDNAYGVLDVIVERFITEETKQDKQYFLNDLRKLINALEENELENET